MSYDAEFEPRFNNNNGIKQPLLHKQPPKGGASITEIQENLNKVSKNIGVLTNYSNNLGKGKMAQSDRNSMNKVLIDTSNWFKTAKELLENYKKQDADMYQRKFIVIKRQLEEVMEIIKEGEKVEIEKAKKTQQYMEDNHERVTSDEYQQEMKMEFKVMEDTEFIDNVIQERQNDINQISSIMSGIKDIATDFNIELDAQGSKLEDLESNMENVADNTKGATKELNEANQRSRRNGKCLLIMAGVIILLVVMLFIILFGTNAI